MSDEHIPKGLISRFGILGQDPELKRKALEKRELEYQRKMYPEDAPLLDAEEPAEENILSFGKPPQGGKVDPKSLRMKRDTPRPIATTRPTRGQLRIIDTAAELRARSAEAKDLIYSARELVSVTLPHRNPPGNPPEWFRKNGNLTLSIRPGYTTDPETGERSCIGYPSGAVPRLLLLWMTTEAVRTGHRRLELGGSLNEFLRMLGMNPDNGRGKRSDAFRLREQMERLLGASISFEYKEPGHKQYLNMNVSSKGELWWDPKLPDQGTLFESWMILGDEFFQAITATPVPIDIRALRALKQSPMALDLYAWIVYRSYTQRNQRKPAFIPWKLLAQQLGANYGDLGNFKKACKGALVKIAALYGAVPFEDVDGGLMIHPERPLIPSKIA